jgi:hypothetical protein
MTKSMSRMTKRKKGNGEMDAAMMISEAVMMNREMIKAEYRGPGDTIEAAAGRLEAKFGLPFSTAMRLWNRDAPVLNAYLAWSNKMDRAAERMEARYEEKRTAAANSVLVRLADFVAGRKKKGTE